MVEIRVVEATSLWHEENSYERDDCVEAEDLCCCCLWFLMVVALKTIKTTLEPADLISFTQQFI